MSFESDCPLCKAEELTRRYLDDEDFWIADCLTCGVPMAVWKSHGTDPSPELVNIMSAALWEIGKQIGGEWALVYQMRSIEGHYHIHLRRAE